jgi:hypothetical protein
LCPLGKRWLIASSRLSLLALRAVTSADGMTADCYPFEHSFLGRVANRIINEVRGLNRVTYDIPANRLGRSSGNKRIKGFNR